MSGSKITLIIGAGQLGSRHLQGVLKCKVKQTVYVLDSSELSLANCKLRESEVEHDHDVVFTNDWGFIPHEINIVIISTSSNVRYPVLKQLLAHASVENIILEKVLFQSLNEYEYVNELVSINSPCQFWVNHPRRESSFYNNLKSRINGLTSIDSVFVFGEDWGLGCNSLHFIDTISFLINSDLSMMEANLVDRGILNSKRAGYVEFTGSVNGKFKNGTFINLISTRQEKGIPNTFKKIYINISTGFENIVIRESVNSCAFFCSKEEDNSVEIVPFNLKFQNELTADLTTSLFSTNYCGLPKYAEAYTNHKLFVGALLREYNLINNTTVTHLPIT
ncbi:MAG: Gfo/Idh/MocA family oxidoreductase [Chitinophagaceae bacterium]|nr:Gfo/Idh/MocA family oxidoreductase [Chitinophagaceae bacterium]